MTGEQPPAEPIEEESDVALREKLGFRAAYYGGDPTEHPDPHPCPPWCWVANQEEYVHEVEPQNVMRARHNLQSSPTLVASLYAGERDRFREDSVIHAATIETHLSQLSNGSPMVEVYLRDYPWSEGSRKQRYQERLRLTIADARELITALAYVCDTAESKP